MFKPLTNQVFQVGSVVTVAQEASMKVGARLQQKAEKVALSSALIVAQANCSVKTREHQVSAWEVQVHHEADADFCGISLCVLGTHCGKRSRRVSKLQ